MEMRTRNSNHYGTGKRDHMENIYHLLRQIGITSKYKGYCYVAEAIWLAMEQEGRPMRITKDIYPCLARKFGSKPTNVEHDIRTVVNICWMECKKELEEIAENRMDAKPTNTEFVDLMAYYVCHMQTKASQM